MTHPNIVEGNIYLNICTRAAQKVMSHIFFLGNYLFRIYAIHAQYNWVFHLHMLFFHTISIFVYGLTPARNKGIHVFPVPAKGKQNSAKRKMTS